MTNLLFFNKWKTLFKAFVESQFKYCPIVWMIHSQRTNNKINRLYQRALELFMMTRLNFWSITWYGKIMGVDKSFCIHHQNIQRLLTEIYKTLHDNSGNSLKELFVKRESTTNLRYKPGLVIKDLKVLANFWISVVSLFKA